jgi:hypothetical protein
MLRSVEQRCLIVKTDVQERSTSRHPGLVRPFKASNIKKRRAANLVISALHQRVRHDVGLERSLR